MFDAAFLVRRLQVEVGVMFEYKAVAEKQVSSKFYSALAYCVSMTVARVPFTVAALALYYRCLATPFEIPRGREPSTCMLLVLSVLQCRILDGRAVVSRRRLPQLPRGFADGGHRPGGVLPSVGVPVPESCSCRGADHTVVIPPLRIQCTAFNGGWIGVLTRWLVEVWRC